MHDQTVGAPQLVPGRVQHVQVDDVLGVESVSGGGGSKTDRDGFTGAQIQAAQPQQRIGVRLRVDAGPHPSEFPTGDAGFECGPAQAVDQLRGGGDAALAG
ncbi:hypothetical protein C1Y40_01926 [Mycobacterium talmoniae]|uniref:Uncharacterized protein n=1 Tax=Mycobacterium talmoniae TaxID=1858794 RepID=A0A2S8BMI9_9MYCO|nr:hypothetical protein C1Y40_01926 [Mycobacterium talmoniae]